MHPAKQTDTKDRNSFLSDMPSVSLILPFNPKMTSKSVIRESINRSVQKITSELNNRYSGLMVELVLEKLHAVLSGLNYSTHKSSIAVYISPVFEKVLYLDMPVEERVMVKNHFEIRDIVNSKSKSNSILVLAITATETRVMIFDGKRFTELVSTNTTQADSCARVRSTDHSLDILLPAYHLPFFVAAPVEWCKQYRKHSSHSSDVLEYVFTRSAQVNIDELEYLLKPFVENAEQLQQKEIAKHLSDAEEKHLMMAGIENIERTPCSKGSLLLVEKGYQHYPAAAKRQPAANTHNFSCIKDSVDGLIEKALLNGGDVEFVDAGLLPAHEHVVLIQNCTKQATI